MNDDIVEKRKIKLKTLKPRKHKQLDFFIADEIDIITFRDEMESMEHPFFALKGRRFLVFQEPEYRQILFTPKKR